MGTKAKLFHRDKPLVGLDITQTGLRLMSLDSKEWRVNGYGSLNLDPIKTEMSLTRGESYLGEAIAELLSENIIGALPSHQVAVSIPTAKTYSRTINLPKEARQHLKEAVELEAEQYIPVPLSELNLDHQIIEDNGKELSVLISAAPRKVVDSITAACETNGLEVIVAEPGISGVSRMVKRTEKGDELPTVVVDVGATTTDIALLNKTVRASSSVRAGANIFTIDISKKLHISLEEAHRIKVLDGIAKHDKQKQVMAALEPNLKKIASEIKKLVRYYNDRLNMTDKLEQVIIVGGGSNIPGFGDYFTNELFMPARVASPWQSLDFGDLAQPAKQNKPRYICAAGLSSISTKELRND